MHGHDATLSEVALPVLVGVLVIYPVLDIVRQQILKLDWRAELELDFWRFAEKEWCWLVLRTLREGTK
jgi:hypothetical protein